MSAKGNCTNGADGKIVFNKFEKDKPNVLVIGGGISGLTTAWTLADRGYKVTVVAAKYASKDENITSQIAGALWEWPPDVCGRYTWFTSMSMENVKRRCLISFHRFKELANNPETGVRMLTSNFFFGRPIESCPTQIKKLAEIKANLPGFRHDIKIMEELRINPNYGIVDCYSHLAPVIDSEQYMDWLKKFLSTRYNIEFMVREITGDLLTQESELREYYDADVIVNCTGLNAKKLVADETVFPVRGAYIRIINDGTRFPKISEAMSVLFDGEDSNEMVFIVPRNDSILVVGGIGEVDATDLNVNLDNNAYLKKMFEKDLKFYPDLKNAQFDSDYPIAVGLRPFRMAYVRVERESENSRIVHNYGHGGSGYSISFGCAEEVCDIVVNLLGKVY